MIISASWMGRPTDVSGLNPKYSSADTIKFDEGQTFISSPLRDMSGQRGLFDFGLTVHI